MKNIAQCSYDAFTLVEMLIVMGVIIVLAAVGITAGRYAINRANDIAHETAVRNVYTALQAYYTDNREFPPLSSDSQSNSVAKLILEEGPLNKYLNGEINYGNDATYYYLVSEDQQTVLVCVSLWGAGNNNVPDNARVYCTGNGFKSTDLGVYVQSNYIDYDSDEYKSFISSELASCNWYNSEWQY